MDIFFEITGGDLITKCPHDNSLLKDKLVGSTFCLHNMCGFNGGFDTAQKIVTCKYGEELNG